MTHIDSSTIKSWDRLYRANFVNCLSGYKPVSLIGTIGENAVPNVAIFSNIVHIGSDPALVGFINRPEVATPHTLNNIRLTKQFTINHINTSFVAAAHQTSAKYASGENEFISTGLHSIFKENFVAPFVAESTLQYALQLIDIMPIAYNKTFLVIGLITDVFMQEEILQTDGFIDLGDAGSIVSLGVDGYATVTPFARYEYARVGVFPREIG
ncbi:MAG: flavin reductase [Ferruginibacter sp.]|nr:flavin reductase [Ferruginibacter sp.]